MEFPDLGQHCSSETCKQLDFLPMKCDACRHIFCKDHIQYIKHNCQEGLKRDIQVPVCPLCNQPVPTRRGEPPDIRVGEHIDRDCQSDPAQTKRNKLYTKKCGLKGCKEKDMISVSCPQCHKNFCLRHRHFQDHNCQGQQSAVSKSGAAAMARFQQNTSHSNSKPLATARSNPKPTAAANRIQVPVRANPLPQPNGIVTAVQGQLTEDEALAMALQNSLLDEQQSSQQYGEQWPSRTQYPSAVHTSQGQSRRSSTNCSVS